MLLLFFTRNRNYQRLYVCFFNLLVVVVVGRMTKKNNWFTLVCVMKFLANRRYDIIRQKGKE